MGLSVEAENTASLRKHRGNSRKIENRKPRTKFKTMKRILNTIVAVAFAPALVLAADPTKPAKSEQTAGSKPPQEAPARGESAKTPDLDRSKEPGKSGDAAKIPQANASKFQGKITAVDKSAKTITINDQKMGTHTLHVGDPTRGATGAQAASWDQLTVGAEVKGVCRKDGDKFHAESLSVVK
jgi:hypothetical protein